LIAGFRIAGCHWIRGGIYRTMSSSSEENDDVFPEERRAEVIRMYEELDKARKEELALVHEWKRKQKLRRKYVDDEPINDVEYNTFVELYDMTDEEELGEEIVPTAKELVWVLGKLFCVLYQGAP